MGTGDRRNPQTLGAHPDTAASPRHGRLTDSSPARRVPGPQRDAGYPLLLMLQRVDRRIADLGRVHKLEARYSSPRGPRARAQT
jgi:hypothetical protein